VTGAWFPRVKVLFTLWPRMMATFRIFAVQGGAQGFSCFRLLQGFVLWRRVCCTRRLQWCFLRRQFLLWVFFFAFDILYLTVCFGFNLAWSLLLSTVL
jgi:hypothetical protein